MSLRSFAPSRDRSHRLRGFDVLRGLAVISMVGFHLCYDLTALDGVGLGWFVPPFEDVWRASISWTFLFVAGCMCSLTRDNLTRSVRYLLVALLITLATTVAGVDIPISFGIIFCMGASTLLVSLLQKAHIEPRGRVAAIILFCAFILCLGLPSGHVGVFGLDIALPQAPYQTGVLAWLGFPDASFASGDYYPLLPYALLYCAGTAMGTYWANKGWPAFFSKARCRPIEYVGRHALIVYVTHQPVLLALLGLL